MTCWRLLDIITAHEPEKVVTPLLGDNFYNRVKQAHVIVSTSEPQLYANVIIRKGDKVTVVTKRGALSVIHQGIALQDASKGERVRVKNNGSTRTIQGEAVSAGRVEIL